jgi:beta-mannosidase
MSEIPLRVIPLSTNWTFKQGDRDSTSEYLAANNVPTEIHRDLLKNDKIADPYLDLNELSVRWVADETWTYRSTFPTPSEHGNSGVKTVLRFQGLDTFASVYLNGMLILESENMFVEHCADVSSSLKSCEDGEENVLEIVFESARKRGLELVKEHDEHRFIVHQTEVSRGPVRKAQYHWGWDWGPILLTCGPWKPISLEVYVARIEDLWVEYELSEGLKRARGKVCCKTQGSVRTVKFTISGNGADETMLDVSSQAADGLAKAEFHIPVELWWPRNYGQQAQYTVTATLSSWSSDAPLHIVSKTIGFRKTELIQDKDSIGTTFYFRINNVDIFVGGSCWIPADSFTTQISESRYRDWVKLAAEGNQTMIRVWGGGIYEADAFYEACDEFGVLVWQDFMFACANYPAYPEYLTSVEEEARQNVRRPRNHPCIVIWAGNNEDYQIVERYGLEYRFEEDKDPNSWLKTDFPARYIYEYLLPRVITEEIGCSMPYHPSSPFGNGTSTTLKVDPTVGDIHQWNVWHGTMSPYQHLPHLGGRFVSEFGMEAYPHLDTIDACVTDPDQRYPGSMAMDFRNKAVGHERRLMSYVAENFHLRGGLESFAHLSQVMQADVMTWAYKVWRRRWGSEGDRKCGGVLVWQLNDCWPTMSWAVVDYYLVPKPAYYAIKREMAPVVVGVTRKFRDWTMRPADELWKRETGHIDMQQIWEDVEFDVWVANSKMEKHKGKVIVRFISIRTGADVRDSVTEEVTIRGNATTEVLKDFKAKAFNRQEESKPYDPSKADPFVIFALVEVDGKRVASHISWPDPIKYLDFGGRGVTIENLEDGSLMAVSADKPLKGFVFSEVRGVKLSDNGFDLVPGYEVQVRVSGDLPLPLNWKASWVEN